MKTTMFNLASWIISDSRRVFFILFVIMLVLTLAVAAVPNGVVLAEDIIGGS
jgi:hypothetical protein